MSSSRNDAEVTNLDRGGTAELTSKLLVDLETELMMDIDHDHDDENLSRSNNVNTYSPVSYDNISDSNVHYINSDGNTCYDAGNQFDRSDTDSPLIDQWHCHSKHKNGVDRTARNQLITVCTLCVLFMIGETVGGVLSNSLALFTDVVHLASDMVSFLISLLAIYLSKKPATRNMSFGFHRAEVLGALFSVFLIWLVTGILCYMAVERIQKGHYKDVNPDEMLVTASVGVAFNVIMGIVLHSERCCGKNMQSFGHHGHSHHSNSRHSHSHQSHRSDLTYSPLVDDDESEHEVELASPVVNDKPKHVHHKNINVRAAFIHVIGDIIQSVGVLIASLIIKFTEDPKFKLADPICTFIFSILVIFTTVTVLRDTLRVMMEGAPRDICFKTIMEDLRKVEGVKTAHSLLIWSLTIDKNVMSVHLTVGISISCIILNEQMKILLLTQFIICMIFFYALWPPQSYIIRNKPKDNHQDVLERANQMLRQKYDFHQTTIQVERYVHNLDCAQCIVPI